MKLFFCILFLAVLTLSAQDAEDQGDDQAKSLAILPFTDHTKGLGQLSATIPDLLITELVNIKGLRLVERGKVEEAKKAIAIENENFNPAENQLEVGKWLGAEYLMLGSITRLGSKIRIDMRVIDVKSGTIHFANGAQGYENDIFGLIEELAQKAKTALSPKNENTRNIAEIPQNQDPFTHTQITRKILFTLDLKLGLFTTRNFPIQKIRLYIDGHLIAESAPINQFNRQWELFEAELTHGEHQIDIVHGIINRKGEWVKAIAEQPSAFKVWIDETTEQRMVYSQTVYNNEVKYSNLR